MKSWRNIKPLWRYCPIVRQHYRVTWDDAILGHEKALLFGGASGTLNQNSIRSALDRPYNGYFPDIHRKAAALLHSIVSNHGFADANKRTGFILMKLLIIRSGYELDVNDLEVADTIVSVASGNTTFEDLAKWFQSNLVLV